MKKTIFLLIGLVLMLSESCFAMQFYQSEKLGKFYFNQLGHGFMMEGATSNVGSKYTKVRGNSAQGYGKGMAVFGYGKDGLYVSYNAYEQDINPKFGNKDMTSYIRINAITNNQIYKVNSDSGITLYPIVEGHSYLDLVILGKRQDGTFVKYIDSENLTRAYFGLRVHPDYEYYRVRIVGDTIIFPYVIHDKVKREGEFRFKWDEKAQWFGVEKVDY